MTASAQALSYASPILTDPGLMWAADLYGVGAIAEVELSFTSDGNLAYSLYAHNNPVFQVISRKPQWGGLGSQAGTFGDSYEVRATPLIGSITSGPVNTWVRMLSGGGVGFFPWLLRRAYPTPSGNTDCTLLFEIRRFGTTQVLASALFSFRATLI